MTDQVIIECENCHEYRHRSRFNVGRRFCDAPACQEKEGIALLDIARRVTDARRVAVAIELDKLLEEPKPENVKGIGWRIVVLRMQGMSPEDIARELNMKVGRVKHEEEKAMHTLHAIALDRIGVQA
jgi:hypothetical protein